MKVNAGIKMAVSALVLMCLVIPFSFGFVLGLLGIHSETEVRRTGAGYTISYTEPNPQFDAVVMLGTLLAGYLLLRGLDRMWKAGRVVSLTLLSWFSSFFLPTLLCWVGPVVWYFWRWRR